MDKSLKHSLLCLLPFLLLAAVAEVVAGDELTTFIVHVQPHEKHVVANADDRKEWYMSFLPEKGRLVHAYHHVATGFAARLTLEELDEVSAMPGFVAAVPDRMYRLQTTHTPQFLGLNMNSPPRGNSSYGADRGAGVIIGVLDTGVFPFHPSFSNHGMPPPPAKWKGRCEFNVSAACNNKLIGARSFVSMPGDANDTSPLDEHGHGTHTAATAAGSPVRGANVLGQAAGVAVGMAPRAHVAVYKVCNASGVCPSSDILAGADAAVADGCDVISVSLGGDSAPFHGDALAVAAFGAAEKGVLVSMAAGNDGPVVGSVTNEAPWALTVAASTMDRAIRTTVVLGNGASFHGESIYQPPRSRSSSTATMMRPLVYAGASRQPLAALCGDGSLDGLDVRGKIVVCEFGGGPDQNITAVVKGEVVRRAGGAGMILPNFFSLGYTTLAQAHVLPASNVDYAAGLAIMSYILSAANPVARIVFGGTVLGTRPAPAMAFFSSRGPSLQNPGILKPDVTGPGVNVLAAWPSPVGPPSAASSSGPAFFNIISGTSMSTPHLSGIAAAIKSKHPGWSPAAIKSAIMTTADATDRSGGPILDEQHHPADWFAIGAGHVNPEKAARPGLVYDTAPGDYVGYLCGLYGSQEVSVIARRAVNCSAVTVIPNSMLNYPSISVVFPRTWNRSGPVVVRRTAKSVGKVPSTYTVKVDMPAGGATVDVSPSKLVFTEANQEQSFNVTVWPPRRQNGPGKVVQGALRWVSGGTYTVRSPISISFD